MEYTLTAIKQKLAKRSYYYNATPKEIDTEARRIYTVIQKYKKQPKAVYGFLTVQTKTSVTATLEVKFSNGTTKTFKHRANGGGYDREDAAIAYVLNEASISNLVNTKTPPKAAKPEEHDIIPMYKPGKGLLDISDFENVRYIDRPKSYFGFIPRVIRNTKKEAFVEIKW